MLFVVSKKFVPGPPQRGDLHELVVMMLAVDLLVTLRSHRERESQRCENRQSDDARPCLGFHFLLLVLE